MNAAPERSMSLVDHLLGLGGSFFVMAMIWHEYWTAYPLRYLVACVAFTLGYVWRHSMRKVS